MSLLGWIRFTGLVLLVYLLARLDWHHVAAVLGAIPPMRAAACLGGAVGLFLLLILLRAWRFCILLPSGHPRPVFAIVSAVTTSGLLGMLTPGRLGDMTRIWILEQAGIGKPVGLAIWICERGLDLAAMASLAAAAIIAGMTRSGSLMMLVVAFVLLFVISTVIGMGIGRKLVYCLAIGKTPRWLGFFARRLEGMTGRFEETLRPRVAVLALTGVMQVVCFLGFFLVAYAFVPKVPFIGATNAYALSSLVVLLPVSIGGVGTREASNMGLLGAHGVGPEAAFSISLIDGTILPLILLSILGGLGYLFRRYSVRQSITSSIAPTQ